MTPKKQTFILRLYTGIMVAIALFCGIGAATLLTSIPEEVGVTLEGNRTVGMAAGMLLVIALWSTAVLVTGIIRWAWWRMKHAPVPWGVALGVLEKPKPTV